MTKGEQIERLKDPKFFMESFTKIKGKTPGLIPFVLNEAQKDFLNVMRKSSRAITCKARQIGFSTLVSGYLYHRTITNPGMNTALIGYNADLTSELLDKVKTFYRTTPDELKPKVQYNSKYEISFPALDSKILVLPSSENVGRGYTLHNVLCTELGFWDKPEEKMLAIENAVPRDGKIIVESTPNGVGNLFHRMCMADNDYEKRFYGWWWHYSEDEIDIIKRRINDPMKFAQEYELEFLASGRSVFDQVAIKRMMGGILKVGDAVTLPDGTVEFVKEIEHGLRIYKQPVPGKIYMAGVDVAEGVVGGDYSVMTIFDRETGEEVAFYRGYVPPDVFGSRLNIWGRLYNNALMAVEINNHGLTTVTALKNLMYPQLYFRPSRFDTMGSPWSEKLGWKTTKVTRPLLIDDLAEAMRNGDILLHSKETLDEMLVFIYDSNGNMVPQGGYHDDCIFSTGIAFQGFKVLYKEELVQLDYEKHMPSSFSY